MKKRFCRILCMALALCLPAALACPAFAADIALNQENNWTGLEGRLIMPGDTVSTVVFKDVSEVDHRITVTFKGASLSMEGSFCLDPNYLKAGHSLEDLSGFTPSAPQTVDVIALSEGDIPQLSGVGAVEAVWTTSYTNTTDFPVMIKAFTSGNTTEHYYGVTGGEKIYVYSVENNRPEFTPFEPYYSLSYEDMGLSGEELSALPDRYYIDSAQRTITLPVLQREGRVLRRAGRGRDQPGRRNDHLHLRLGVDIRDDAGRLVFPGGSHRQPAL